MMADVLCSGSSRNPVVRLHADVLVRMQQREQLGLVFQIRTRRIPERVARARDISGGRDRGFAANLRRQCRVLDESLVPTLGQRFGRFHAQAMQVEVLGVLSPFEKLMRLVRGWSPMVTQGHARAHPSGRWNGGGKNRKCTVRGLPAAVETEAQELQSPKIAFLPEGLQKEGS